MGFLAPSRGCLRRGVMDNSDFSLPVTVDIMVCCLLFTLLLARTLDLNIGLPATDNATENITTLIFYCK